MYLVNRYKCRKRLGCLSQADLPDKREYIPSKFIPTSERACVVCKKKGRKTWSGRAVRTYFVQTVRLTSANGGVCFWTFHQSYTHVHQIYLQLWLWTMALAWTLFCSEYKEWWRIRVVTSIKQSKRVFDKMMCGWVSTVQSRHSYFREAHSVVTYTLLVSKWSEIWSLRRVSITYSCLFFLKTSFTRNLIYACWLHNVMWSNIWHAACIWDGRLFCAPP